MTDISLNYNNQPHVIARNPDNGTIQLDGLGALQAGQMWFKEAPCHKNYPGYHEAKIVKHPDTGL